jgi:Bifunctional DNA primase/polymerase, N-terminal
MGNDSVFDTAQHLVQAGVSVIPIGTHKRPAIPSWKPYQTRRATMAELEAWFAHHDAGLAVVAGKVSDHVEILDFDDPAVLKPWYDVVDAVAPGLVSRLVAVMTPTGGCHLYYRCAIIQGNQKLAVNAQREVMIETRGEGGYALIPPSPPWCHPDHKPYVLRHGDLAHIPTITAEARDILLNSARALTQYMEPARVKTPRHPTAADGTRPGDLFAAQVRWEDILRPHGWTRVGQRGKVTLWKRPGKRERGWSATTGHFADVLYVFSSNAVPFEPETAYSKFAAYALLNHAGDFSAAARALHALGYRGECQIPQERFGGLRTIAVQDLLVYGTPEHRRPFRTIAAEEVSSWRK